MTFEYKILASLTDVTAFVFECNQCKSRTVIAPSNIVTAPHSCPRGHSWNVDYGNDPRLHHSVAGSFISSLKSLQDPTVVTGSGFRLYLEFDQPDAP